MTDLKPSEKTFWDATFLAALQGLCSAPNFNDFTYEDTASFAEQQATAATLARRKVWEEVQKRTTY